MGKNNHSYDCEYVYCYKYNDSCHQQLGVIKQRERYSEMSALLQTLTQGGDVETADTSIQATWQSKFRLAKKPVPSQKTKTKKNKQTKMIIKLQMIKKYFLILILHVMWLGMV